MGKSFYPEQFVQILTPILADQRLCRMIAVGSFIHLTLIRLGQQSWPCPFRSGLGIPCPGCGLSRALVLFLQGNWHQAILTHAFAPIALMVLLLIVAIAVLPTQFHVLLLSKLKFWEKQTGFSLFCLLAFICYWFVRLLWFPSLYRQSIDF